jgi:penicillin-binding protein 2
MKRTRADHEANHRGISRRAAIVGGVQLVFIGALAARMRHLQINQADQFRLLAEENRIKFKLIPPARGEVFDRNGVQLAQNIPTYQIKIVREDAGDVEAVIYKLGQVMELKAETVERALTEIRRSKPFHPVTIAEDVAWDDLSRVSVNAPALPGVTPEIGLTRVYPRGSDFAHILGYVGPVSDYDLDKLDDPDELLRIPRFQIGKVGVEAKVELPLRGKAGTRQVEVNAAGREMRELGRREGRPGSDLQLTIDSKLQGYVQARLGEESASAVVIDCDTGDLVAIASAPTYDPNLFVRGISVADYKMLTDNTFRPLASKTVQGAYPPGSTFKMITAMAALEEGIMEPEDTVRCPGHLEVADRKFHCWKRSGHGSVDLLNSLKQSCDVYYYDLALKVGIEKISAMANMFGLGIRHDVPMSAVTRGLTPTKAWKKQTHDKDWVIGDTVNASIGQGYMLSSPMQLAVMTARLATGRSVNPRLVKSIDGVEQPNGAGAPMPLDPENLRKMRRAMFAVVNDRRGTAYGSRIIAEGMRMAGKTGTSQVRNISSAERARGVIRNADLAWNRRDHALFVDFAPADNPKYAVAVVVEHGGGGSTAAAPIARDITLQALYGGEPPLEAYPSKDRGRIASQQRRLRKVQPIAAIDGKDQA